MSRYDYLDIRSIADEWNDELEAAAEGSPSYGEMAEIENKYLDLCDELGIGERTPDELRRYGDSHEPTLVHEDYFETYAQELAEDICPFPSSSPEADLLASWPYRCIDWEAAARELKFDYTSVDFDGETYYIWSY